MKNFFYILLLSILLSSCSTTRYSAPVVDRVTIHKVERPQPVVLTQAPSDKSGYYTVKKGDSLLRIALDHGQNYRDIVAWNNLTNPNDIKVDQVLRVTAPETGIAIVTSAIVQPSVHINSGESKLGVPIQGNTLRKSEPRGEKYPYSEAAWAGAQKTDSGIPIKNPKEENQFDEVENKNVSWVWPTDGKMILGFDGEKNKGIDISGKLGQPIVASGSGKVMYAGTGIRAYGNLVIVRHSNDLLSTYGHNRTILVKEGQNVVKGQVIAEMGNSDADIVKLHFEIRRQGKPVDPLKFLPTL